MNQPHHPEPGRSLPQGSRIRGLPWVILVMLGFVATLVWVALRRLRRGPAHPAWNRRQEATIQLMRRAFRAGLDRDLPRLRRRMDDLSAWTRLPRGVTVRPVDLGGVPGAEVTPNAPDPDAPVILYFHGGGYIFCSSTTHGLLLSLVARAVNTTVVSVDYRLAPEHPFPAAVDDALTAYRHLLQRGRRPEQVVLCGDSAGGGLALALLLALRDRDEPLPARAALLSPWLDPAADDRSMADNAPFDYLGSRESLLETGALYCDADDHDNPLVSPIHADLSGLPPIRLYAGEVELLRDQIQRFSARAEAAGAEVQLTVEPAMVHVWPSLGPVFPQGKATLGDLARFCRGSDHGSADRTNPPPFGPCSK